MATKMDFNAAFLGPDLVKKQAQLQQNQMLAQQLLQAGQTPQEGQMVSGHYVAPSVGAGLANALKGYYGMQLAQDLPRQNSELAQAQFGQVANLFGGQNSQTGQPGQPMQQGTQPTLQPLPGLNTQQSALLAGSIGVPEYLKMQAQSLTPTELQKNLIAQGIQPGTPQWQQALGGNLEKTNYIAPVSASPGSTMLDPRTMKPTFSAPQDGIQLQYGPNGQAQAMPVAGYGSVQAGIEGQKTRATAAATASQDLVDVFNPVTKVTEKITREQAAQRAQAGTPTVAKENVNLKQANEMTGLLQEAKALLPNASNGAMQSRITRGAENFGVSSKASKADAQLNIISAKLVGQVPRFEGPQSDADRILYQKAAGDLSNPDLPVATRSAALQTMEGLNNKYLQSAAGGGSNNFANGDYSSLW